MPRDTKIDPRGESGVVIEIVNPAKKKFRRRRCKLERCDELFEPKKKNQLFCSTEHKDEWHFKTPHFRKLEPAIRTLVREMIRAAVKPGALK